MLKHLHFTNFKIWTTADLEFAPITGLFGTNSSGKTSLIQFLLMLKQTKDATDRAVSLELNGGFVQLGSIRDVINRHDESKQIEMSLTIEAPSPLALNDSADRPNSQIAKSKNFVMKASISVYKKAPRTRRLEYEIDGLQFSIDPKNGSEAQFDLTTSGKGDFRFIRTPGRAWQLPGPVKNYAFPDQARTYYQNAGFLSDLEAAYEAELDRIFYLGPLREFPKRDYLWARSRPSDVGQRGEKAIDAILAATEAGETRNLKPKAKLKPFQEMIAYWLNRMGLIHEFKVKEISEGSNRWQAVVKTRPDSSEVLLTDVGFGVSQVLPVITLLYYVPEGATVILEQPEIHLHPLAQANLADVIINAAIHRRVQVIVESHSEHLLLRLQRRIAENSIENSIASNQVKLYFCHSADGQSKVDPLRLDLFGNIQNWPKQFMGDAFGETAAAEKARLLKLQKKQ